MWYADRVWSAVEFVREDCDGYWSREPSGYINIIKKSDAQIVEVANGCGAADI